MRRRFLLVLFLASACGPNLTRGVTYAKLSLEGVCQRAEIVFRGTVESIESTRNTENGNIYTHTTFRVTEWIHGEPARETVTIRTLGGTVADETLIVHGMPRFEPGREYIVFVRGNNHYVCPIVGGPQGCFPVVRDDPGGTPRVTSFNGRAVVGVNQGALVLESKTRSRSRPQSPMTLGEFEGKVRSLLEQARPPSPPSQGGQR